MPRTHETVSRGNRLPSFTTQRLSKSIAVIVAGTLITAVAPELKASVVFTDLSATPVTTSPTNNPGTYLNGGPTYYQSGGIYLDMVDGTTTPVASSPPGTAVPTTSTNTTTGPASWQVHLISAVSGSNDKTFIELPQVYTNASATGEYADFVTSGSSTSPAALLTPGTIVGPTSTYFGSRNGTFTSYSTSSMTATGNWAPGSSGYIGVEFTKDNSPAYVPTGANNTPTNNIYYGWVAVTLGSTYPESITVTGFAYENVANTPITIPMPVPEPASLGLLAVGGLGLGFRRRRA